MRKLFNIVIITAITLFLIPQLIQADTYSSTTLHWGFKKSQNHEPPDAGQKYNDLLKKHHAFYLGDTSKKEIYLTFDNGYENGYTAQVLDILKIISLIQI
jgi:peptidoglycan-N-acetylmuramic acid deacetylase